MPKLILLLATLLALPFAALAQEHYTEGPLWRVQLIRVKPNKMDAYLASLRESTKPLLEEQKKQGSIVDYKVFLTGTKDADLARPHVQDLGDLLSRVNRNTRIMRALDRAWQLTPVKRQRDKILGKRR